MTTAFVLSGGASLGAIQVGMLQALAEQGIRPDLLVGTSAGSLNAAWIAGHGCTIASVGALADVWHRMSARSLFAVDPIRVVRALAGRHTSLCSDRGLRSLLEEHLTFDRLEAAPIPLIVVTTDLFTGDEVALRTGSAADAVRASCAIPGVFPHVDHEGRVLVDGGLANNTAVSQAVAAGADKIYVLPAGYACALPGPPRTPLAALAHAVSLLTHQRLVTDVGRYADATQLVVLPPPCPLDVSAANFARSRELVSRAHSGAAAALSRDGGLCDRPEQTIAVHHH